MPRVIADGRGRPVLVWARRLPKGVLEQLQDLAAQPYIVDHVAAMPDVHVAKGVAVGTVFATEATLVPAALGGDLGCGMSAVRFDFPAAELSKAALRSLLEAFARAIPVGDSVHRGRGLDVPDTLRCGELSTHALQRERDRLLPRHLGTLGGGNHFVELDRDGAGNLWLLVHSGSRGLGAAIAGHHIRAAEARGAGAPPGLEVTSPEGDACLRDLTWAIDFARANRDAIGRAAEEIVSTVCGAGPDEGSRIDVHHNYVARELHAGRALWVHRKGAIAADVGAAALIPGSMGTASYVVRGLGDPRSFRSASHGAGRVMSRREAREKVSPRQYEAAMRRVVYDPRRLGSLIEEAPAAYRDIREVLEDEADLVEPVVRLEPVAVLKG